MKKDIDAAIEWYKNNRPSYEALARKVEQVIKENLEISKLEYHSIFSRVKTVESFGNKAKQEKYSHPIKEIYDMAGIRVITYLESDVQKIADIVEKLFAIDKDNSLDQSKLLGSDRVGYRSVHYVATFDKSRCKLPEYSRYESMPFEIQLRSLLQHAWAEIDHDRNFKFRGKLPADLERRFYLVAGILECADREFVTLSQEVDKYRAAVVEELTQHDFNISINTVSLREYLSNRFSELIGMKFVDPHFSQDDRISAEIVEEVRSFGPTNLSELDKMIPADYHDILVTCMDSTNFAGIIRDILIINDVEKYFEVSWQMHWRWMEPETQLLYEKYDIDLGYVEQQLKEAD